MARAKIPERQRISKVPFRSSTSAWGGGDEVTAAILEAAPTRKRKHMAAARAGDTDDGAMASADFDPTSVWGDGDEVTAAIPEAVPTRKRKHMAAARADDTDGGAMATAIYAAGIGHGDASPGIDTGVAADAGRVAGGVPDGGLDVDASADAHSSATKKRRRKYNRGTQDSQKHCR